MKLDRQGFRAFFWKLSPTLWHPDLYLVAPESQEGCLSACPSLNQLRTKQLIIQIAGIFFRDSSKSSRQRTIKSCSVTCKALEEINSPRLKIPQKRAEARPWPGRQEVLAFKSLRRETWWCWCFDLWSSSDLGSFGCSACGDTCSFESLILSAGLGLHLLS